MKIAVAGTGYVGLANSILLAQHNEVVAVDIVQEKVDLINSGKSPIVDNEIVSFFSNALHFARRFVNPYQKLQIRFASYGC